MLLEIKDNDGIAIKTPNGRLIVTVSKGITTVSFAKVGKEILNSEVNGHGIIVTIKGEI